jgi:hypothetical protein
MPVVVILLGALLFAPALLGFLLWLSHLEDTLQRDVHRALRRPEPPPILAIPIRRPVQTTPSAVVPEQRSAPELEPNGPDTVPVTRAGSASDVLPLAQAVLGREHEAVADIADRADQRLVLGSELGP